LLCLIKIYTNAGTANTKFCFSGDREKKNQQESDKGITKPTYLTMKIGLTMLTIILALLTLFIAIGFVHRLTLSYNSEGTYFDENTFSVYHEQAVTVYGILVFIGLVLTLLLFYKTKKAYYK
jgi:uncharacterized membrane protein YjgN (DUF898 family)